MGTYDVPQPTKPDSAEPEITKGLGKLADQADDILSKLMRLLRRLDLGPDASPTAEEKVEATTCMAVVNETIGKLAACLGQLCEVEKLI